MLKLKFLGASRIVTGSSYLLELDNLKVLIDCGMFQGPKEIKEKNYNDFPYNPGEIDYLLLTHAHIDHSGLIPKLYKSGFKGRVVATSATTKLASIMLPDSGHIQEMEVERKNRKKRRAGENLLNPIYTALDAEECLTLFDSYEYDQQIELTEDLRLCFRDAGHILGSSIIEVWAKDKKSKDEVKLVFSGDLGNYNQPIINDPSEILEADFVIMESTYGNRSHYKLDDKKEQLAEVINFTYKNGGNLIIPAFAIGRTQDILYQISELLREKKIPRQDIYIDSPLAVKATEIFCECSQYYDKETKALHKLSKDCIFDLPNLHYSLTAEESMAINNLEGVIIISASGMCDAGRIKHHLKHNLWKREATVLLVGYQAEGTLGRRILDGEKVVKIHGESVAVNSTIKIIDAFSAHADQAGLLDWAMSFKKKPACYFIAHGEERRSLAFAETLQNELGDKNITISVPHLYEEFDLLKLKNRNSKESENELSYFMDRLMKFNSNNNLELILKDLNSVLDKYN